MEPLIESREYEFEYSILEKCMIIFVFTLIISVIIVSIVMGFYASVMTVE